MLQRDLDKLLVWECDWDMEFNPSVPGGTGDRVEESKKISNDQELIQSDPISCPQNQKGNN